MWTKSETEFLIKLYKKFPELYDWKHKYYSNQILRKEALQRVAKELSKIKPDVQLINIKMKIKTLRAQFFKNKKKTTDNLCEPTLWCYEQLEFLNLSSRNAKRDYSLDSSSSDSDSLMAGSFEEVEEKHSVTLDEDELIETERRHEHKELKETVLDCVGIPKDLVANIKTSSAKTDSPALRLGRLVTEQLAEVSEQIFIGAKSKIIEILRQAAVADMEEKSEKQCRTMNLTSTENLSSSISVMQSPWRINNKYPRNGIFSCNGYIDKKSMYMPTVSTPDPTNSPIIPKVVKASKVQVFYIKKEQ